MNNHINDLIAASYNTAKILDQLENELNCAFQGLQDFASELRTACEEAETLEALKIEILKTVEKIEEG